MLSVLFPGCTAISNRGCQSTYSESVFQVTGWPFSALLRDFRFPAVVARHPASDWRGAAKRREASHSPSFRRCLPTATGLAVWGSRTPAAGQGRHISSPLAFSSARSRANLISFRTNPPWKPTAAINRPALRPTPARLCGSRFPTYAPGSTPLRQAMAGSHRCSTGGRVPARPVSPHPWQRNTFSGCA